MLSNFVMHMIEQAKAGWPWTDAAAGRPSAVLFWYRQSPAPLTATRFWSGGRIDAGDPLPPVSGMIALQLDAHGRLQTFVAVPDREQPPKKPDEIPWHRLFTAAGLDEKQFTSVEPDVTPPVFADRRAAWEGVYPENPSVRIRLDAASAFGRPVYFSLREPWTASGLMPTDMPSVQSAVWAMLMFLLLGITGALLAIRNLRLGRVDLAGATRLATVLFLLRVIASALTADYPYGGLELITLVTLLIAEALFLSALVWVGYAALEPHVRRRWPEALISWARLISGRWRDPRVGRDVLIGVTTAVGILLCIEAADQINIRLGLMSSLSVTTPEMLDGWRFLIGGLLDRPIDAVLISFALLLLLLVTTLFVRSRKLAMAIVVAAFLGPQLIGGRLPVATIVVGVAVIATAVVMLWRVGVLPLIVSLISAPALDDQPLPLGLSVWFAPFGWFAAACVVALACYGFYVALAGRPLSAGSLLDD